MKEKASPGHRLQSMARRLRMKTVSPREALLQQQSSVRLEVLEGPAVSQQQQHPVMEDPQWEPATPPDELAVAEAQRPVDGAKQRAWRVLRR